VVHRLISIALLCSSFVAFAQAGPKAHQALDLSIRTDRTVYGRNDSVELQLQITNYGPNNPYIWKTDLCWECVQALKLHVIAENGREISSTSTSDLPPIPPRPGHPEDFIRIEPGTFYGTVTDLKAGNLFTQPGKYELFVTYDSGLPVEFVSWFPKNDPATKIPVRTEGDPTLTSNRLQITLEK
jgi:hypothetical protein